MNPPTFARGTTLGIVLIGALAFAAVLYWLGTGSGPTNNGGGHAGGRGLNGYAALAAMLEADGVTVHRARSKAALKDDGLLILTPPAEAKGEDIAAMALYLASDGMEYGASSNEFDLRFVPDETRFGAHPPRDSARAVPDDYIAPEFATAALQNTRVESTWDGDELSMIQAQHQLRAARKADIASLATKLADALNPLSHKGFTLRGHGLHRIIDAGDRADALVAELANAGLHTIAYANGCVPVTPAIDQVDSVIARLARV
jgi:hypothetical protein